MRAVSQDHPQAEPTCLLPIQRETGAPQACESHYGSPLEAHFGSRGYRFLSAQRACFICYRFLCVPYVDNSPRKGNLLDGGKKSVGRPNRLNHNTRAESRLSIQQAQQKETLVESESNGPRRPSGQWQASHHRYQSQLSSHPDNADAATAPRPTPPHPKIATVSISVTRARATAWNPTVKGSTRQSSSRLRFAAYSFSTGTEMYSVKAPFRCTPSVSFLLQAFTSAVPAGSALSAICIGRESHIHSYGEC